MPETPETPEEPQGLPPTQETAPRRPTQAESTPGGVGAPLGTETYETRPLPALDALLQTNFMEDLGVKGLKDLQPHGESHEPFGDDRVLAFGPLYLHDRQYEEYTKAGMSDADSKTVLFTIGAYNAQLTFGWSLARNVTDRAGAFLDHFNANLWDPAFMGIAKSHTGTPGVQPDMDSSSVSRLDLKEHDVTGVRRLEFQDTDQSAGNDISLQQRGDAAGAILEIVSNNDATQYSSPIYRRLRLADPVGADDATTKRYVDALSYAGHTLLDASLHTDTLAAGVTDGSIVIGNVTPKWSELVISIPAANVRNVLGVDNGELRPSWKAALDTTNPVNAGGAAAPGTSLVFSHRNHVHAVDASHSGSTHHAAVTLAADAQELLNLSTQELGLVAKAANLVFAGPAAGAAADPTFRSLVDADIPAAIARDSELHDILTIGADAAHSLATQALSAVLAANGQTGHMSGAMFDKLAAIEAAADVTDATNVAAAGAVMDSDISPGEGFLRKTGAGTYTAHKSNLAAGAAPDANEDSADGYSVGSVWIDTTNDNVYVCVDATEGAAVWRHLNAAAGAHGPGTHTSFANWKLIYTDGSGDQQELALGAAATYLRSAGAASAPTMSAIPWGDVGKAGSSIADLATRTHASLSDAPADAHHAAFTAVPDEHVTSRRFAPTIVEQRATADTVINSGVDTDITGATVTLTPDIASMAVVWATFDVYANTAFDHFQFFLDVDGVNQPALLRFFAAVANDRKPCTGMWVFPLTAASHTMKLQGNRQAGIGAANITQVNTKMIVMIVGDANVTDDASS